LNIERRTGEPDLADLAALREKDPLPPEKLTQRRKDAKEEEEAAGGTWVAEGVRWAGSNVQHPTLNVRGPTKETGPPCRGTLSAHFVTPETEEIGV
jgi:hypothetical protein